MSETESVQVRHEPAASRYAAYLGDTLAGFAEYRLEEDPARIVLVHTVVEDAFEGRGVGSALARGALEDVRARAAAGEPRTVVPECPFIASYLHKHPEYADLA